MPRRSPRAARAGEAAGPWSAGSGLSGGTAAAAPALEESSCWPRCSSRPRRPGGSRREQEAGLFDLEVPQGDLAGSVLAPTEDAAPATPSAPAITTLMIGIIPMGCCAE
ncbi:unnamed protein product [Prorocentrum cordatum]|uniref:Uncharacterized protein n=1 Tax=Prorocentrum cordatum TaxID=2364126 RepID=A0ABN9S2U1_9DINO|nr:unnamed protein product [Polarella glacialis]